MTDAREIHAASLVIDCHADTPQRFVDEGWDFTDPLNGGQLNLATAKAGNLAAEFFAIWVEPKAWAGRFAERTLSLIDGVLEQVKKHPDTMRLGLTPSDIVRAYEEGVFCALMGIEGGHSIENDLELLRRYHHMGVRYMTLTWANNNDWADSSGDVRVHGGLTEFGRSVVREMNRLGMMVDVSHASDETFWDVLKTTHAPIIASHSSARALTHSPRNLTDEQLRAIATNNGVVMVNFYPAFIDEGFREAWAATAEQRKAVDAAKIAKVGRPLTYGESMEVDRSFYAANLEKDFPLPPLSSLIDHFDHIAQVAGIDHIGIGTDFDGIWCLPGGMESAADLPMVTAALAERGYTAAQLQKLLGGNLLRVFGDVQAEAARE